MYAQPLLQRCWIAACVLCVVVTPGYAQEFDPGEVEEQLVGTWVAEADPKSRWVFTEDGMLKQYVESELDQTVSYEVNAQCEDPFYGPLEASSHQVAMLELTRSDGEVSCKYITQWVEDDPERPEYFTLGTEHETILFERQ